MKALQMKPCPFCGGAGRLDCGEDDGKMAWAPECENPECVIYGFRLSGPEYESSDEATTAWNQRTDKEP